MLEELSPTTLAQKIKILMEQPALYQDLAKNCKLTARQLNWEAEEKILIAFYQDIVEGGK
ncbi:MAG: hypothetical protein AAGJ93_05945 [Bacteroidota bacterium]